MNIDWTTVIFEMINFALLVVIMVRFVFRPVARTLDQRKAELAARAQETAEREAAAAAERARYEAELEMIDTVAEQRVNEALSEARAEAERIVSEAREEARGELDKASAELEAARRRTLERFRGEVLRLGSEAARRVVRELGVPEVDLAFARRAAHTLLDALGQGETFGLVEVRHSTEVDPDALAELLRAELGREVELHLAPDPDLVGGVRLQARGHEVEASAGASLEAWYRGLVREGDDLAVGT
jgi:F-type H+-transporting ATPase subunit b